MFISLRTKDNGKSVVSRAMTAPPITVAPKATVQPSWMWVRFTLSVMFSKLWNCRKPSMIQSLPKLTAFQSEHCSGRVTIVRRPIRHPIHRRMELERIVPAQNARGPLHQMKKQSCAKK